MPRNPTPSQGAILAHFQPGETYSLSELAEHFDTSKALLQLEMAKMAKIHSFGHRYRLIEAPTSTPVYMRPEMDLRKHYGSVIGRVADYRAIPSRGGD